MTVLGCSSPTSSSGSSADAAPTTEGAKQAAAYLADFSANPTSIVLDEPLPARPPAGKSVITLTVPLPVAKRLSDAEEAAAKKLGWDYSSIAAGATPASAVAAFEAALSRKPDAIAFSGYPASLFADQIRKAKAAGIAVVSNATGDGPVDGVVTDVRGTEEAKLYGRRAAAYFVVHSGAKGKAGIFNINAYPILTAFVDGFQEAVRQWCPDCGTEVLNQQLTDPGTTTPNNVVSYLQRHPDAKWVVFSNGDISQGVSPAIRTAGLTGINIMGEVPTEANLANLASKAEAAWVADPVDILGWRVIDILARHFVGADTAKAAKALLPGQVITADNVTHIVVDHGFYVGVEGYQAQFARLWKTD
ncbi:sugar ABC transporter substrate-binding protein [Amycolatopsis sp. NBC_01480]|uniref:sugar ABC transporter substrate-binding protein n=1 Tax=Amycolatopsis sp. NBC_01480 TaxID=2903562 RepID=UPI002E295D72|nr:substrate-binding domain-containing protein [Amycolatopsis sp. NBC_01480]